MGTELAGYLLDDSSSNWVTYQLGEDVSSGLLGGADIDLRLECEEDKSYALPTTSDQLQLHSTVNMRISLEPPSDSLSCKYCKCNFLIESHLHNHMEQFHFNSDEESEDRADQPPSNAAAAAAAAAIKESVSRSVASVKEENYTFPASPIQASTPLLSRYFPTAGRMKKSQSLKIKRKNKYRLKSSVAVGIRKSKSEPEIKAKEQALYSNQTVPVQMVQLQCDVQSDSASDSIDVESGSPGSSPTVVKNGFAENFSVKKKASGAYVCPICAKPYVTKYALKRHVPTHSEDRPFICQYPACKGAFKLKSRLTDHIRYVHKRKTQNSLRDPQTLPDITTPTLAHALLSASSLSSPRSGRPAKAFLSKGKAGNGPVSNGAVSNGTVTNGQGQPVTNRKPFKCPMPNCNRKFRDSHNLQTHVCLHTGHLPLKCLLCEYRCVQKASLDHHMKNIHAKSVSS